MDTQTLGAAIAIAKKIPGSAAAEAIAAADRAETAEGNAESAAERAETAAESVEESAEAIEVFENTGITMQNGKICVKVERG